MGEIYSHRWLLSKGKKENQVGYSNRGFDMCYSIVNECTQLRIVCLVKEILQRGKIWKFKIHSNFKLYHPCLSEPLNFDV